MGVRGGRSGECAVFLSPNADVDDAERLAVTSDRPWEQNIRPVGRKFPRDRPWPWQQRGGDNLLELVVKGVDQRVVVVVCPRDHDVLGRRGHR